MEEVLYRVKSVDWKCGLSIGEIQSAIKKQTHLPVQIFTGLLLSDAKTARNVSLLQELGVTHVLNMAGPKTRGPVDRYHMANIQYLEIDAQDEEGYQIIDLHLQEARMFIEDSHATGGTCLVHCLAGMNRSGVIVAAELMLRYSLPVVEAVRYCRQQRGNFLLNNYSFQQQLVHLAMLHGMLDEK